MGSPHSHKQPALGSKPSDRAVAIVHAENGAVGRDSHAVGIGENALPPGTQDIPIGVEHNHGDSPAIEDIHIIVGVHIHGGAFLINAALGQRPEILAGDPVKKPVLADNRRPAAGPIAPMPLGAEAIFPVLFPVNVNQFRHLACKRSEILERSNPVAATV